MAFIFTTQEYQIAKDILQTKNLISTLKKILDTSLWTGHKQLSEFLKEPLLRACAWYLYKEKRRGCALNTVGMFRITFFFHNQFVNIEIFLKSKTSIAR